MSRILVVDDDTDLVEGLRWFLEAEGYEVTSAESGEAGIELLRKEKPDLIVLDVMMAGMDGIKTCEAIRGESDVLILMLSARDGEIDKVRALKQGADDYLTKPFHVSELVARIQALLRRAARAQPQTTAKYRWMGMELFPDEREVKVNGALVDLTTIEFDLLAAMMCRPRMVFSRDQLIETIWGDDFYGDSRLIDNHVYHLREKLTKAGMEKSPIATIRGVGYAFRPEN